MLAFLAPRDLGQDSVVAILPLIIRQAIKLYQHDFPPPRFLLQLPGQMVLLTGQILMLRLRELEMLLFGSIDLHDLSGNRFHPRIEIMQMALLFFFQTGQFRVRFDDLIEKGTGDDTGRISFLIERIT